MSTPTFGCEKMDVAVLSSGGKDTVYAVWWAIMKGWNVRFIITLLGRRPGFDDVST